jgi:nucleotide-binding universal stress UspA family protein
MPLQIVLATDGSEDATAAAMLLTRLPLAPDTKLVAVTVLPPAPALPDLPAANAAELIALTHSAATEASTSLLGPTEASLASLNLPVVGVVRTGHPSAEIVELAEELGADLIVVGARGRSASAGFNLGAVAHEVVRNAPGAVLVVRGEGRPPGRVLVAVDGSAHASAALHSLSWFPLPGDAEVLVLSVVQPFDPLGGSPIPEHLEHPLAEIRRQEWAVATRVAAEARAWLADQGWRGDEPQVREGQPAHEILRAASEMEADLIVIGSRGQRGGTGYLLGSVAQKVVRYATASVLITKRVASD